MNEETEPLSFFKLEDFVPSLRQEFEAHPLDLNQVLVVGIPIKDPERRPTIVPAGMDRHSIVISDGKDSCFWKTDSLQALFRGNQQPPHLGDYPEAYQDAFFLMDYHVLQISRALGDRRDTEMKEIYAALRRRPDGRSVGFIHDYMWQAAAWVLGTRPLSQAEFEAIMGRLERSCRTFEMGPTSRNYVGSLRSTIGQGGGSVG